MEPESPAILVVDDDPLFRKLLANMLQSAGWRVQCSNSAEEALERLASEKFQILVTDLRMDGLGGTGLIRELNRKGTFRMDRILVVTGVPANHSDSVWVSKCEIPILRKPFTVKGLLESINLLTGGE